MLHIHDMEVTMVALDAISQHPENANNGDIDMLQESIEVNGFFSPLLVQRSTGYIIAGNHRYLVAHMKKAPLVPVIYLDVSDFEAKRMMLADNRVTRAGHDDEGQLANILQDLFETDLALAGTGYNVSEMNELLSLINDPLDLTPIPEEEPEKTDKIPDGALRLVVEPVADNEGTVYEFSVHKEEYKRLTQNDLNLVRKAFGQQPLTSDEFRDLDMPGWR